MNATRGTISEGQGLQSLTLRPTNCVELMAMSEPTWITCPAPGCTNQIVKAPYCPMHRKRLARTGQLEAVKAANGTSHIERIIRMTEVAPDTECWTYQGSLDSSGYAHYRDGMRTTKAHIVAYREWVGPIPAGLELDHLCSVRSCCNPAHLDPVTGSENQLRAAYRRRWFA